MMNVMTVMRRELQSYLRTPMGYIIAAVVLAVDGLLFNAFSLGRGARLSSDVIRDFFYFSAGTTMIAGILLSMRLFAEERQTGTLVLLRTAPVRDSQMVVGKFLAALFFLSAITLLTLPMPLLVMVHGKISVGHLCSGYLGLFLLGSATIAIGTFGSALANDQVVAAISSTAIVVTLLVAWMLARVTAQPLADVLAHLAMFDKHFIPFMRGLIHSRDIIYFVSVTYVFLLMATLVAKARRWQ